MRSLVSLVLVGSVCAAVPGGPASAAVGADQLPAVSNVPYVKSQPLGDTAPTSMLSKSPKLGDSYQELPDGQAQVKVAEDWTDVEQVPVEIRASDEVTTVPEDLGGSDLSSAQTVPSGDSAPGSSDAPPVTVEVKPSEKDATPALLVTVDQVDDTPEAPSEPADEPSLLPTPSPDSSPSATASSIPRQDGSASPSGESSATASPTTSAGSASVPEDLSGEGLAEGPGSDDIRSVELRVSYADFRYAYAGDWGSRLQVFAYPACHATTPETPGCDEGFAVPSTNDPETQTVTFNTTDLNDPLSPQVALGTAASGGSAGMRSNAAVPFAASAATTGVTYALVGGSAGEAGDFAASVMTPSASWQVGESSGDFSYSYPINAPAPAVAGPSPSLGLSYSSQSVDGMTKAANGQASMVGLGWSMEPGHISRSFARCADDGDSRMTTKGDLCWKTNSNGVVRDLKIVLNGHASRLIQVPGDSTRYRLEDDPAWQVDRVTGTEGSSTEPDNTDDNNEAFKVRSPDGMLYWFGWGHGTESTATVPVFGNNSGEPCYQATLAAAFCNQAWQWNLDRVVDPNGNSIVYTYERETNYYKRFGTTQDVYDRNIYLEEAVYGRSRGGSSASSSSVRFSTSPRCIPALTDPDTSYCQGAHGPRSDGAIWPDVPGDLICGATDTSCSNWSPSFFSTRRYNTISTWRTEAGNDYRVDTYPLTFSFPKPGASTGNEVQDLWLSYVGHQGGSGTGLVTLPSAIFGGVWKPNRVVKPNNAREFDKYRINHIVTETGGLIDVVYGHGPDRACTEANLPTNEWGATRECFPQKVRSDANSEWWHKYVVTRVALGDDALGYHLGQAGTTVPNHGRLRVFDYEYEYAPGWRWRNNPNVPDNQETWDDWRGYGSVYVHQRTVGPSQVPNLPDISNRRILTYRGLHGGRANGTSTTTSRVAYVPTLKWGNLLDYAQYEGRVAEEIIYNGSGGYLARTDYEYRAIETADDNVAFMPNASYVYPYKTYRIDRYSAAGTVQGPTRTITQTVDSGSGSARRFLLGTTTSSTDDMGTTDSGDDIATCTNWVARTTDEDSALRVATTVRTRKNTCVGAVLAATDTYYDNNPTLGAVPSKGMATMVDNWVDSSGKKVRVAADYDSYGRQTKTSVPYYGTTNPGLWTTTSYNPDSDSDALVTKVRTSTPSTPATGDEAAVPSQVTTATLERLRGLPVLTTDANGKTTTINRDGLGRINWVDLPDKVSSTHSIAYDYSLSRTAPTRITTTKLRGDGLTADNTTDVTYDYYDGWGRSIESQVPAYSGTARVFSSTGYDEVGRPWITASNAAVSGISPSLVNPEPTTFNHYQQNKYDGLDRPTEVVEMSKASKSGYIATTKYVYTASAAGTSDEVKVYNEHESANPKATTLTGYDAAGRANTVSQFANGNNADASKDDGIANYGYDDLGRLTTITTPSGGASPLTYSYSYDWLGRRTEADDPDTGHSAYQYDAMGNQTRSSDAYADTRGSIATAYDVLGRPIKRTAVKDGTTTPLADWTYDGASAGGIGRPTTSTSHTPLGDFTQTHNAYDGRGNPTQITYGYPAVLTGEGSGQASKSLTFSYNQADQIAQTTYPAAPGLSAATSTSTYGRNGMLSQIALSSGTQSSSLAIATYDNVNRPSGIKSKATPSDPNEGTRFYTFDLADRLNTAGFLGADASGNPYYQLKYEYKKYDALGNPTSIDAKRKDAFSASEQVGSWCYTYDGISRLTSAATGATTETCAGGSDTSLEPVTGGKYALDYTYAQAKLATVTTTLGGTRTASYAFSDAAHPHATTAIGLAGTGTVNTGLPPAGTLHYDNVGRVDTWTPGGSAALAYDYDVQGNLVKTTDQATPGTAGETTYAYDADGIRVVRKDASATVIYLGNLEITKPASGDAISRRTYSTTGGTPLAIESSDGADANTDADLTWIFADAQGTTRLTREATGTGSEATRYSNYSPYGELLTPAADLPGEHGFLGQTLDPNGEVRLDHRSYDPSVNVLITPDPLIAASDPQSLNPYAYSGNNPIAFADPSGLIKCETGLSNCYGGLGGEVKGQQDAMVQAYIEANLPPYEDHSGLVESIKDGANVVKDTAKGLVYSIQHPVDTVEYVAKDTWETIIGCLGSPDAGTCVKLGIDAALTVSTVGKIGKVANDLNRAHQLEELHAVADSGMAGVRAVGQTGEDLAGIAKNTKRIPSASGKAAYRIPDELNSAVLGEVKNVGRLNYTSQLRDFAAYARHEGLTFKLYTRGSTILSSTLQAEVDSGRIVLDRTRLGP